ncbi:aldose epimerase family protein [Melissococcus plutonius]|uniref:Aldose 1-epimerase n=1 Tax=Melissococcus plutonius (strain ATCC 35311 / DSM 29964 / CIP 104052 / LMG 20360 / NCIMB 702443) TaxID=940190 RepID=F3YAX4_MELPT|nr:aldose epimerase family protein [Melissococcus plutonius]KMT32440.1 aldose 1-epimerase Mro [Melissococcus plutonius]KMT33959.1 aldose 1-epimerase Mro [Melissococcus plutonius]KMT39946.1 aldose 1-epimerase Mro [Melissococcus plutonius]MBB5178459.1 aldose 1-epimerase [Melissococcus plutonius]BAK21652.1 aldose 1-epimerase [Melissococcus plutonius ATCC 35311]
MDIRVKDFGKEEKLYSLVNNNGIILEVTTFGARIVNLYVPVETEKRNIVFGFDSTEEYQEKDTYIGSTIGRVAGRIRKGEFNIQDRWYQAAINTQEGNTLHGGPDSFETKSWTALTGQTKDRVSVEFSLTSKDGENGFPGNLQISVTYTLNNNNEWIINYKATTDQPTLFNPTNHVYFNLTGDPSQSVAEHQLMLEADQFAVVDQATLPTGEKRTVEGSPFDFRKVAPIKQAFESTNEQNKLVDGLDHPFFLNKPGTKNAKAKLIAPDKRVAVEVFTDQSAIVIFTAQLPDKWLIHGKPLIYHGGITFETQVCPGAEEFPEFGNIDLFPGEIYESRTCYRILTEDQ